MFACCGLDKLAYLNNSRGRKLAFINVRSIRPNINLLRHDFELSNLSLIGITESWFNDRIHDNLVSINGFNIVRSDRVLNKRGGGLVMYIHDTLEFERQPSHFNHSDKNLELLTVLLKPKKGFSDLANLYPTNS